MANGVNGCNGHGHLANAKNEKAMAVADDKLANGNVPYAVPSPVSA